MSFDEMKDDDLLALRDRARRRLDREGNILDAGIIRRVNEILAKRQEREDASHPS